MLIHVECEYRDTARNRLAVLAGILIDEPSIPWHPGQQYPAGPFAQRVAHGGELSAPALHRAEVAHERLGHGLGDLPLAAHARKVQLVQIGGIERHELLALQAVDDITWLSTSVEF
jgi:hypothetical protein